jgi:hypothetical protein
MNWHKAFELLLILISVFLVDVFWTLWFIATDKRTSISAGVWSALIVIIGAFTTRHYVKDDLSIIAGTIGAFLGTVVVIEWKKKKEKL